MRECHLCGRNNATEMHHMLHGPYRKKADKLGLVVPLCRDCHYRLHNTDKRLDRQLQREAEQTLLNRGWTREKFIAEFGKNYLEE